jgi:hypothetical protein
VKIQRYSGHSGDLERYDAGAWVKHEDVAALEKRLAEATALLELARDAIDEACYPVWWEQWRAFLSAPCSHQGIGLPGCATCDPSTGPRPGASSREPAPSLVEQIEHAVMNTTVGEWRDMTGYKRLYRILRAAREAGGR